MMLRPYVTDLPARKDLSFSTNSDKTVGVVWLASDGVTPVPVATADLTLEFDLPPTGFDPDTGEPLPDPDPVRHVVDADVDGFALGQVLVIVPAGLWSTVTERSGNWDIVAFSVDGVRRQLIRGIFTCEEGVGMEGVG
jgi:hypothetical protein